LQEAWCLGGPYALFIIGGSGLQSTMPGVYGGRHSLYDMDEAFGCFRFDPDRHPAKPLVHRRQPAPLDALPALGEFNAFIAPPTPSTSTCWPATWPAP
jgi:hypothetical protein